MPNSSQLGERKIMDNSNIIEVLKEIYSKGLEDGCWDKRAKDGYFIQLSNRIVKEVKKGL